MTGVIIIPNIHLDLLFPGRGGSGVPSGDDATKYELLNTPSLLLLFPFEC